MAWTELLTTDTGLMSLATILFMVGMAVYIFRYAVKKMHEDEAAHGGPAAVFAHGQAHGTGCLPHFTL